MTGSESAISAWLLSKGIAICSFIAFVSAAMQVRGLIGANGLLPATNFLEFIGSRLGAGAFWRFPTAFWWTSTDSALVWLCVGGAIAAALAFVGFATPLMFALCLAGYVSLVTVGQDFYSFQWDILLIEVLFLAIFLGPWPPKFSPWAAPEPHLIVKWLFFILLFKLMFLSGVVKIASGDEAWTNLTAMNFHYETQPLPNPLSWSFHQLPAFVQKFSTAMMFGIELLLPFLIFSPWMPLRVAAAGGFVLLQLLIIASGNYTFFNGLTVFLSLFLIPDSLWSRVPWLSTMAEPLAAPGTPMTVIAALVALPLMAANLFWLARPFDRLMPTQEFLQPIVQKLLPFRLNNGYGLFAVMTKTRPEIDIQGSDDGVEWKSYVFKYKPGPLDRRPSQVAPLQPRLDWQMWFAALGDFEDNVWLRNLLVRLLQGEPAVVGLLQENPFPERPPKYVRAQIADYRFTTRAERRENGNFWKKDTSKAFGPVLSRSQSP